MLVVKYVHEQYQDFVHDFLTRYYISTGQYITLLTRSSLITKLWAADLTGIVMLIKSQYSSSSRGAPPKDPVAMFRSLILMTLTGETSIAKWVDTLKSDPFYAINLTPPVMAPVCLLMLPPMVKKFATAQAKTR
jgi:hypothetical protein